MNTVRTISQIILVIATIAIPIYVITMLSGGVLQTEPLLNDIRHLLGAILLWLSAFSLFCVAYVGLLRRKL